MRCDRWLTARKFPYGKAPFAAGEPGSMPSASRGGAVSGYLERWLDFFAEPPRWWHESRACGFQKQEIHTMSAGKAILQIRQDKGLTWR